MPANSEQVWDAIYRLGTADDAVTDLSPAAIAKLTEFKMADLSAIGLPQLTPYGGQCFTVMESGDGVVPELNDMAAMKFKQKL